MILAVDGQEELEDAVDPEGAEPCIAGTEDDGSVLSVAYVPLVVYGVVPMGPGIAGIELGAE